MNGDTNMRHDNTTLGFVVLVYVAQVIKILMPFHFYLDIENTNCYWLN